MCGEDVEFGDVVLTPSSSGVNATMRAELGHGEVLRADQLTTTTVELTATEVGQHQVHGLLYTTDGVYDFDVVLEAVPSA